MQCRKILNEVGAVLFGSVMILSTMVVTASINNESPELRLVGDADYISPSQQTHTFEFDNYIHFDNGINYLSIGLSQGGTFEGAIRITPAELTKYEGYTITAVRWHHGHLSSPPHSGFIKIYDAGNSTNPGSVITSEPFTVPSVGWFEIPLSTPLPINITKDVWVSVQVTHAAGEYPLGADNSPHVPGKGDWCRIGSGTWFELFDSSQGSINCNWNIWMKVEPSSQPPETPRKPEGPTEGFVDIEYTFSTNTTDPEDEQILYNWSWGDGTFSGWLGPYDSGDTTSASHKWTEKKDYEITVQARDSHHIESNWSTPKMIHIVNKSFEISNITGGLFTVRTVITNTGDTSITGVNWSMTLDGGLILLGRETSGHIVGIPARGKSPIHSRIIFGVGKTVITVSAETADFSDSVERDAFVFLFIIQ